MCIELILHFLFIFIWISWRYVTTKTPRTTRNPTVSKAIHVIIFIKIKQRKNSFRFHCVLQNGTIKFHSANVLLKNKYFRFIFREISSLRFRLAIKNQIKTAQRYSQVGLNYVALEDPAEIITTQRWYQEYVLLTLGVPKCLNKIFNTTWFLQNNDVIENWTALPDNDNNMFIKIVLVIYHTQVVSED